MRRCLSRCTPSRNALRRRSLPASVAVPSLGLPAHGPCWPSVCQSRSAARTHGPASSPASEAGEFDRYQEVDLDSLELVAEAEGALPRCESLPTGHLAIWDEALYRGVMRFGSPSLRLM